MIKIGLGRYQDVFREDDRVFKIPIRPASETEFSRMEQYYNSLKSVGVSVPKYFGRVELQGKKATEWEYKGKPLSKSLLNLTPGKIIGVLEQILNMGLNAYERNIAFYPILEQFTLSGDRVSFVDFFPPRNKEDFEEYNPDKRAVLSLMFYGLTQKVVRLSKQILAIDPTLKEDIEEFISKYLAKKSLNEWNDQIIESINFLPPKNLELYGIYIGINRKRIRYYSNPLDVEDSDEWILVLPSRNIWSRELFSKDLESVVSLGLIETTQK